MQTKLPMTKEQKEQLIQSLDRFLSRAPLVRDETIASIRMIDALKKELGLVQEQSTEKLPGAKPEAKVKSV